MGLLDETTSTLHETRKLVLPQCPDENIALAHEVTTYFEHCERKFIEYGYLNVARRAGLPDVAGRPPRQSRGTLVDGRHLTIREEIPQSKCRQGQVPPTHQCWRLRSRDPQEQTIET